MLIVMMCGAVKLLCVIAVCDTLHNTIINDNAMMSHVNDMYTGVITCTSIDLHDKDVA